MPPKPSWIRKIPQMRATLEEVEAPLLDRAALEKVFKVSPRRALKLAHKIGCQELGHSLVVSRARTLAFLTSQQLGTVHQAETLRRRQLREKLEEAQRDVAARSVKIAVTPGAEVRSIANLPPSVQIGPGQLRIEFADAQDLLGQLLQLSQAISRDYVRFEEAIRS